MIDLLRKGGDDLWMSKSGGEMNTAKDIGKLLMVSTLSAELTED